jgi:hypothetical protein
LDPVQYTYKLNTYDDPDEWWNQFDGLQKKQIPVYEAAQHALEETKRAKEELAEVQKTAGAGTKLVLVNFAGLDYDHCNIAGNARHKESNCSR